MVIYLLSRFFVPVLVGYILLTQVFIPWAFEQPTWPMFRNGRIKGWLQKFFSNEF